MSGAYDVIVVGLGGMGSAVVYHLARRGQRVLGIERFTPAHDRGSSHGRSRIIRQAYLEDPAYVPLILRAYELWQDLERQAGERLLTVTGGLMMGREQSIVVAGSLRSAREHGLDHELLDAHDIHRRYPPLHPEASTVALYEPNAGYLDPERCTLAHQRGALAHGAELHFEEQVQSWTASSDGGRVSVTSHRGTYEAGQLVVSPGPWAPQLLADLKLPLVVDRQILFWFDPMGGADAFSAERFPIYVWLTENDELFYGFPAQPGPPGGVKVAFGRLTDPCSPDALDRTVHPAEVERMHRCVAGRLPGLSNRCLGAVTCMYTSTPDGHFVVGRHPHHRQVIVLSPCSGHGFKFASVIGELAAELACDGATRHPVALFSPDRFR